MSEPRYAELIIGPWVPEQIASTEEGRTLLNAVNGWGFEYVTEYHDHGIPVIQLQDPQANYGSAAFTDDLCIFELASPLSLWCGINEESWSQIYTSDGLLFNFPTDADGAATITQQIYHRLSPPSLDVIDSYWELTLRSLGAWINDAPLRLGVSPNYDIIYKALVDYEYELRTPFVTSERLAELAQWPLSLARQGVAKHSHTPAELLVELSTDANPIVREAVAGNPNTETQVLTLLTGDDNEKVAQAAREQLTTRPQSTVSWMMGGGL